MIRPLLSGLLHHWLIIDHIVSVRVVGLVCGMCARRFALVALVQQDLMRIDTPTVLTGKLGASGADNVVERASRPMCRLLVAASRHASQVSCARGIL